MKKIIKHSKKGILLVTMMVALTSFANTNKEIDFGIVGDINKTALIVSDVKVGDLLTIKDHFGVVLYKESIKTAGIYKKGFNLASLPDGDYSFEIEKDLEIKTIPFTVEDSKVIYNRNAETSIFKPYVKKNNDLVFITKVAPNSEPLKIDIYANHNGNFSLLYSELVENTRAIEKVYKLKDNGKYKITLSSDGRTYTKFINN